MAQYEPVDGEITPVISVVGYDKGTDEKDDERTIVLAKANAVIYFSDLIAKYQTPAFMSELSKKVINPMFELIRTNLGTFGRQEVEQHDLILTDPPYVTSGSRIVKDALEDAGLSGEYGDIGRGTEAVALRWVMRALKRGGRAFIIVPDGLLNQESILREVKELCIIKGIISLPRRTFYSTTKKTYILAIERKSMTAGAQSTPVFVYRVSEIGETRDARRLEIQQNDLTDMSASFNQFKGAPNSYVPLSENCKVIPWVEFNRRRQWMVDREWGETGSEEVSLDISALNDLLAAVGIDPIDELELDVPMQAVELGDKELFSLSIGKRVTRAECTPNGGIACISANVHDVFGFIEHPVFLTDFDTPSLLWGMDGNFDWAFVDTGYPFHPTDHCGVLRVLEPTLSPEYLYYALRERRDEPGFDRVFRAKLENIKRIMVEVPVMADGSYDLETQELIASRWRQIEERRLKAEQMMAVIETIAASKVPIS